MTNNFKNIIKNKIKILKLILMLSPRLLQANLQVGV